MTKREQVQTPELGMKVYHDEIYRGKELMEIVGIRKNEVELKGDYSGGTHPVIQKDWESISGLFRLRKVCDNYECKAGRLNNLQCAYPDCSPYVTHSETEI